MSHPQPAVLSAVEDHEDWQPHAAEEFLQVGTVGKIAIGLLGASTVTHLLSTWSDWNTYSVVHRYLGGMPNVDDADLNRADAIAKVTAVPNVIVSVAAAVIFVVWLWRARVNSEVFCQADHRRSHGWVLASWFCPGPNLWYPKQIVDDVWLASDPKTPVYTDDLRRFRTPALTSVWWVTWIGALAFDVVVRRFLMWMEATVGSLRGIALAGTASLVLTAVSAVAATMVIRKINAMQTGRKWIPWWDQREPKLTAVPTYADDDTDEQPAISEPIATSAPARRLERQPELQFAGGGAPATPFANGPVSASPFGSGTPFGNSAPAAFAGDGAFAGGLPAGEEEPPKWSPFAPVVQSWQESGPETQQFNPVETWQESKPVQETVAYVPPAPVESQPAATQSWTEYRTSTDSDPYTSARSGWQDETPPLTVVKPDPYAYQPQPTEPSWASNYSSDPYSYTNDYLTQTSSPVEPETTPAPEPAPVARAGRRAARVAVDSPSAIQPSASTHAVQPPLSSSPVAASAGYYEPAPVAAPRDDFLTPSKPLPPVPSFGPEPSYSPEPVSSPESSYSSYDAQPSSYETSYTSDYPSYDYNSSSESSYSSSSSDYGYSSSDYTSSSQYTSYDSYSPSSYSGSDYSGNEPYESYSPNYTTESYSPDYGTSSTDYYTPPEQPVTEYQQAPYSYDQQAAEQQPDQPTSTPRTHPRRRWV